MTTKELRVKELFDKYETQITELYELGLSDLKISKLLEDKGIDLSNKVIGNWRKNMDFPTNAWNAKYLENPKNGKVFKHSEYQNLINNVLKEIA